ncbi:hypothetical protein [Cytobacillus sp. Bac17]|uniref:hypothetical protein n=1 Tax=Cytobacillus sp. Bac17 TaxID=2926008 RepID=UPI002118A35E|nr:hypothetical protein [Cytobacillus sp. Bac17]
MGLQEITDIFKSICSSFNNSALFELLVACEINGENQLFHVTPNKYEIVNSKSIGSGSSIPQLTSTLSNFTLGFDFNEDDSRAILSKMVAFLQVIIFKNGFLDYGVGGTVCGACLEKEVIWNDDILYFFYAANVVDKNTLNVFIRDEFVLTGSDFTDVNKLFATLLPTKNKSIDGTFIRKVNKIISTGRPRYIVFYSKVYNCMYFCDLKNELQTNIVRIYYKRGRPTNIELLINPNFSRDICSRESIERINIPVFYVDVKKAPPLSREEALGYINNLDDVHDKDKIYDIDLNEYKIVICNRIDIDPIYLNKLSKLVLIDFEFLFKSFKKRYFHFIDLNLDISNIYVLDALNKYIYALNNENIDNNFLIFYSNENSYKFNNIDLLKLFRAQITNASWYNFDRKNYALNVYSNTCKLLQDYYLNEDYFGLNKLILVMDNKELNEILSLMPAYNWDPMEADIILIKSHKLETKIKEPITYYIIDQIIDEMFNISPYNSSLWDSYKGTDYEQIIKNQILDEIN